MPKEGVEIIDYISQPLSEDQLTSLIIKLGITPIELVRKGEAIWKELYKGNVLSDAEITAAMAAHPTLNRTTDC
jgi:arsenate reductase